MILSQVAIVGGTLIAGVKIFRDEKRKKEFPWTVAAERLAKNRPLKPKPLTDRLIGQAKLRLITLREELKYFLPQGVRLNPRQQQLVTISSSTNEVDGTEIELSDPEKELDHYLKVCLLSLGQLSISSLFYPPLNILSLPALIYATIPFYQHAYRLLFKERKVGVALVDLIGISACLALGYYFVVGLATTFIYFSRKLLIKTEDHSRKSLTNIFYEQPRFIWVVQEQGIEVQIPFDSLSEGDTVIIHAGQTIPIDGTITSGYGRIDQRTLTGESQPVDKGIGDPVFASTFLLSGQIYIQVEKAGGETLAAQIGDILNSTADFKSTIQSRGERIVDQGAAPTLALSALGLLLLGPQSAVSIIYSPFGYHLRVAAPISVLTFLRITSENGILVKDGRSLELLSTVDTFVFDKTGTLTEEVPTVGELITENGISENELLSFAAAAEYKQTHPIALAIRQEASKRNLNLPSVHESEVEVGYGVKVKVEEGLTNGQKLIRIGSGRFMEMEGIELPAEYEKMEQESHAQGYSLVYVAINDQLGGAISLMPTIRKEVKQIVESLRQRKMSIYIISGDHEKPTQKLAQELGIDNYFAETLPENKAELISKLQEEGRKVCFVGDGINDSIALKTANVSISLRGASTVATDTAGIILMDGSLKQLINLLDIAYKLDRNLKRSTVMAVLPSMICIGGIFFLHFGLLSAIIFYNVGLMTSVLNALLPLIKHEREKRELLGLCLQNEASR